MSQSKPTLNALKRPWMLAAYGVLLANVLFNVFAAAQGQMPPWLLGLNLTVALLFIGAGIIVVGQIASRSAAETWRVQAALDASQARLSAIVDSAMDAIITVDEQQRIVLFNRAAEQVFRCRREDVLGSAMDRFLPTRFRAAHHGHIEHFGRTGVTSRRMGDVTTLWAVRADSGDEFPIEASISQATEGGHRYYTVILRDITVRKQYEDELKQRQEELRMLSAQVLEAREEEKTRIARELHDELGQLLTAMRMDLLAMQEALPAEDGLRTKVANIRETIDETVMSVRRIAADLRPLMLDDLGLADAAAWLVEDFGTRSGIRCEWRLSNDIGDADIDRTVANTVYRALQESLTNIGRHAKASQAWVLLQIEPSGIRLEVEDNGRGIAPADMAKSHSLGLKGMRERVHHIGGMLEISGPARGGTRVSLRVPLRPRATEVAA